MLFLGDSFTRTLVLLSYFVMLPTKKKEEDVLQKNLF